MPGESVGGSVGGRHAGEHKGTGIGSFMVPEQQPLPMTGRVARMAASYMVLPQTAEFLAHDDDVVRFVVFQKGDGAGW